MIKDFDIRDLGYFIPNEFSDPSHVLGLLTDDTVEKKTLWHSGMVEAIFAYREYWPTCWGGFFLVNASPQLSTAVKIRDYIAATIKEKGASRLQTDSVANDKLDKWHRFLGFQLEGRRVKMMRGLDYHCWAIVKDGGG